MNIQKVAGEPPIFRQLMYCAADLMGFAADGGINEMFILAARIRGEANRVAALEARVKELESLLGDHLP